MTALDRYAEAIVQGRQPAGKYHRLSCVRHLRDRSRENTAAFPYRFDYELADRFFRFTAKLKHYKGEWSGQFIVLQPHQQFRLGSLFAWVHRDTQLRRFRTAYNEIPRKNGKSLEAACVALYVTFFDGEPGAEGYCVATKREQAKVVFGDAKRLVKQSGLRTRIEGSEHKHGSLYRADLACKLEALGADSDSTDGLNPNLIINDEFHAQKDREMLDVIETATGARRQPLNFQITTAGSDPISPCGYQHDYACKILDRTLDDETFFCFIAHADPEDDWTEESTWRKANPNYGVSVLPTDLRALATKATQMEPAVAAFKQKRLNLWVNAISPWLSADGWRRGQSQWSTDEMIGQPCTIGIDLSSKIDLTAFVIRFPPTASRPTTRLIVRALTPDETLQERARRDHAPYQQWVREGWLSTNPGSRIDQAILRDWMDEARARYRVNHVGIDPYNAGNLVTELEQQGLQPIEVSQNVGQMSGPSKNFEADVLEGLVDAGGNPLMRWCVSNAVVQRDQKDNIYPVKTGKNSRGRIDPVIAALLAHKVGMVEPEPPKLYQAFVFGGAHA